MLRGADSRVGRGVKNKPHLLDDLAKAKGKRLLRAYESNPYPAAKNPYPAFPTKQLKQFAKDSTIGYVKEAATNIRHPIRRLTQPNQQMEFPGGKGDFFHPGIGPRKIGGIYQSGYSGEAYKVLDIKHTKDGNFSIKIIGLPNKNNPGLKLHQVNPRWHSTWWDEHRDKVLMDPSEPKQAAPLQTQKDPPVYAPRSVGDSADPMVRALNRLSASSPNNVAKLLIEAGSPIRQLLDARLGAKPIHSTGSLMDTHGGFPRRSYVESHVLKGNQSHLPVVPDDPKYGSARFVGLTPERRAALNRVLFQHLYQTRN